MTEQINEKLVESCKALRGSAMDMASTLNRLHTGTVIDYEFAEKIRKIELAARLEINNAKAVLNLVENS